MQTPFWGHVGATLGSCWTYAGPMLIHGWALVGPNQGGSLQHWLRRSKEPMVLVPCWGWWWTARKPTLVPYMFPVPSNKENYNMFILWHVSQEAPGCSAHIFDHLCQDSFVKTCRRKIEQISEEDLYVEGEFMAEQDMEEEGYKAYPDCIYVCGCLITFLWNTSMPWQILIIWSILYVKWTPSWCLKGLFTISPWPLSSWTLRIRISAIKAECAKHVGWIRLLRSSRCLTWLQCILITK